MKHVRITITANGREAQIHPMYDVMANAAFVDRATAIQWNFTGDGFGILHYVEGDIEAFEAAIAEIDLVIDYELEPAGDGEFYAYIWDAATERLKLLFEPLRSGGVVSVPPIQYNEDGTVTLSLFGLSADVQTVVESIQPPIEFTIEEVGGLGAVRGTAETRLSDRQREAVEVALDCGYYEVPREASHEDVADRIDCAPSTAAEHLRKAESTLLQSLVR